MSGFEYKVVAAPRKAKRVKGVRAGGDRFASTVADIMNEESVDGWEYYRADSLPMDDRPGMLKSRVEVYQSLLVFRRKKAEPPRRLAPIDLIRDVAPANAPPLGPASSE